MNVFLIIKPFMTGYTLWYLGTLKHNFVYSTEETFLKDFLVSELGNLLSRLIVVSRS